jgi:hypothetical protein
MRSTTTAALAACLALLTGCAGAELGTAYASANVAEGPRTDEVRCREAEPRLESLQGALDTLHLAHVATFDDAHAVATSALTSWVETFEDADDGPLADAYESGERKLAHLERMDATTPHQDLLDWVAATLDVAIDAHTYCADATAPY